jgi:MoaA/NifB/PqqE/SkfB family radical SAM enzyme
MQFLSNKAAAILRTLTVRRVLNYTLLNLSYYVSQITKKPIHWGTPAAISIEPTTACNLGCPQCPSGLKQFTRPTGNLKTDLNTKILDQVGRNLQYINYYFQGEPFINPSFLDLVKDARSRNIYVVTSTNAHFISPEVANKIVDSGLSEIIISIDGLTQETYEKYRVRGELSKVLEGTKNIIAAKKRRGVTNPIVTFQFLVVKYNEAQISDLYALADELGVDNVTLKTIQVYDFETGGDLIPDNPDYARYKKNKAGKFELKNKFKNSCWRMWSSCVFTWDAKVVPCCFDKDAQNQLGSLDASEFNHVWKSDIYSDFRAKILKNRQSIDICKNCSEGSKIWI